MTRRLFRFASLLSLMLCLGTVVLWVRSYWIYDRLAFERYAYRYLDGDADWGETPPPGRNDPCQRKVSREVTLSSGKLELLDRQLGSSFTAPDDLERDRPGWYLVHTATTPQKPEDRNRINWPSTPQERYVPSWDFAEQRMVWPTWGQYIVMGMNLHGPPGEDVTYLIVPLWMPVAAMMIVPAAVLLWHALRRRRALGGRCVRCGYNLTGNASGVCPECGTPTTAGVKA